MLCIVADVLGCCHSHIHRDMRGNELGVLHPGSDHSILAREVYNHYVLSGLQWATEASVFIFFLASLMYTYSHGCT